MAEYIEREALIAEIEKAQSSLESNIDKVWYRNKPYFKGLAWANRLTRDAPTADVVEVVRCKDCMYGEHCYPSKRIGEEAEPAYWCKFMDTIVSVDGYCAYGKKMDGKGEG